MSTQQSKGRIKPRPTSKNLDDLKACAHAQDTLTRATEKTRAAEDARRKAVRAAYANGHSAGDIADSIQVSRAKVYQLIGGAFEVKVKRALGQA